MRLVRSPLALIFSTVLIHLIGFGIVIPVLPLYAERFGASPLVIGCLVGIYSAMQCVCAPLLGKLSDRVGRRPVLLVSLLGTAAGFLVMGVAQSLPLLFVGRIIDGATGGSISTAQAYIADVTTPQERSRGMGLIGAAFGLGFIFGPALGGIVSRVSLAAPFLLAALLSALNALAVYCFLPESLTAAAGRTPQRSFRQRLFAGPQGRPLLLTIGAYFVTTVAFSMLTATYPLFTERRFGYSAAENGYLFALQGVFSALMQGLCLGWLVKRVGDRRLAMAGALVLGLLTMALSSCHTIGMLLIVTAGIAIGHGLVVSPLNSLASQRVTAASQGRALGLMQSAASLARIVGPVLGGWLLGHDALQPSWLFGRMTYGTSGVIGLLSVGLMLGL